MVRNDKRSAQMALDRAEGKTQQAAAMTQQDGPDSRAMRQQAAALRPFIDLLNNPRVQRELIESSGGNVEWTKRLSKIARQALTRQPELCQAAPFTLVNALVECAQLGLEPVGVLGHAYLVTYNNKQAGIREVQVQIGYKGLIALAMRRGQWAYITGEVICENDDFDYAEGSRPYLYHKKKLKDRGEVIGAFSLARPVNQNIPVLFRVIELEEIHKARSHSQGWAYWRKDMDKYEASGGKDKKPWKVPVWEAHFNPMAIKTAVRRMAAFMSMDPNLQAIASLDELREMGKDKGERIIDVISGPVPGHGLKSLEMGGAMGFPRPSEDRTDLELPQEARPTSGVQAAREQDLTQPAEKGQIKDAVVDFAPYGVKEQDLESWLAGEGEPPLSSAEWTLAEIKALAQLRDELAQTPQDEVHARLVQEFGAGEVKKK